MLRKGRTTRHKFNMLELSNYDIGYCFYYSNTNYLATDFGQMQRLH